MIIDYWEWPPSVHFDSGDSYNSTATSPSIWIDAPAASMDTIDYNASGSSPDIETVGRLSYACGVATVMDYSSDGSSSDTRWVPEALLDFFDYDEANSITIMASDFYDVLEDDMIETRPAELGIWGMGSGGHAIVADGFMTSGEYHLNMGWGGYANGWYSLPGGMPEGFNIVGHQASGIMPPVVTRRPPLNLSARALGGGGISLEWEVPPFITESILHYSIYRKTTTTTYELVGTTPTLAFEDSGTGELIYYTYGVSATYASGESPKVEKSLYSGIVDGWARTFGGVGDQVANSVAPAPGFGCVAVGHSRRSYTLDSDAFIVRTVAGSSPVWGVTLGGAGDDDAQAVIGLPDSTFIFTGSTESFGAGGSDLWLVKLDDSGDTLWTRTFGTGGNEHGLAVAATPDGGYIMAGYAGDAGSESAFIVKTNSDGDAEWTGNYAANTIATAVIPVLAGGYMVAGYSTEGDFGRDDYFVMKLDATGDSVWARHYGGSYSEKATGIVEILGGGFVIAGNSYTYGIPIFSNIYLFEIDSDGDSVRAKSYGGMSNYTAHSIAPALDGGLLVAGSIEQSSNIEFYILKTDDYLDTLWTRSYGSLGDDVAYSAVQLEDTGIVVAGKTFMNGNNDFWILKFGGDITSRVREGAVERPGAMAISAYPNPFNSAVRISVVEGLRPSRVEIFDINGKRVRGFEGSRVHGGIPNADNRAPISEFVWFPDESVGSGVYLIRATVGDNTTTRRIVYLR